ncbi:MAG TPA: hypothetical protein PLX97_07005, partial [Gemmatales bacterium]|nr:hypothetical protein [Gemmatales bacterium]
MQPVSTQRRLSVWRFLLACAMGLVASLVIHWLLAPKPAWMIHVTSNEMRYHPICEDASGRWLLVSEERNQQGRYQESAILILNAATGDILYRLDEEAQCLNLNMLEPHERYPRLIGEALFRFKRIATDSGIRHELRRWNFTQSRQEELIQAWTVPPRVPFEVTFAPDDSPYFLIQTICPWQMGIVTLGVDTWTALTNSMTWAHYLKDPYGTPIAISPNGLQEPRAGWNPWIETFALPTGEAPVLKKLASWTLPPLRWTWPPSVGPRLDWVTFGDSALPVGWKSSKRWIHPDRGGVMPQGVLLFDGHTGQQRAVEVLPEYQNQLFTTSSMGDHFWIHHLVRRPTLIDAEYQCLS